LPPAFADRYSGCQKFPRVCRRPLTGEWVDQSPGPDLERLERLPIAFQSAFLVFPLSSRARWVQEFHQVFWDHSPTGKEAEGSVPMRLKPSQSGGSEWRVGSLKRCPSGGCRKGLACLWFGNIVRAVASNPEYSAE